MKAPTLFDLGFRVFFLAAGIYSAVLVGLWSMVYFGLLTLPMGSLQLFQWHAHEMVFGYAMAVIAGFLLTATANWTGLQTLRGWPLAGLAALWLVARCLFLSGYVSVAGLVDFLFIGLLTVSVAWCFLLAPRARLARVRSWEIQRASTWLSVSSS